MDPTPPSNDPQGPQGIDAEIRRAILAARRAGPALRPLQALPHSALDTPIESDAGAEPVGPVGPVELAEVGEGEQAEGGARARPLAIQGYVLSQEISSGGQATVYRAVQESTGRQVAIKVLPGGAYVGSLRRHRFDREARVLATLSHPNVVGILDRGRTEDGSFFIVMEFIDGLPLDEHLGRGRPSNGSGGNGTDDKGSGDKGSDDKGSGGGDGGEAGARSVWLAWLDAVLHVFEKICDAVQEAHAKGIVHRDLKPSNVRVDARGEPHVLDFGLAWLPNEAEGPAGGPAAGGAPRAGPVTVTGQILGSLPWSGPEQVSGVAGSIGPAADVYSLGVMLFECLTGRFPYDVAGTVPEVIRRILTARPPTPSSVCVARGARAARGVKRRVERSRRAPPRRSPALPRGLDEVVLKALAKGPRQRYATAGELGRDLAGCRLRLADAPPRRWRREVAVWWPPALAAAVALVLVPLAWRDRLWAWWPASVALSAADDETTAAQSLPALPALPDDVRYAQRARSLIRDFDSTDPNVRQAASLRIMNLDGRALEVVEVALRSPGVSSEARGRLQAALKYLAPRAVQARRAAAVKVWQSRTLHDAYQGFGRTGAAFDAPAHRAIDLFLQLEPDPIRGPEEPRAAALAAFREAVDKGCQDPLILCLRAATDGRPESDPPVVSVAPVAPVAPGMGRTGGAVGSAGPAVGTDAAGGYYHRGMAVARGAYPPGAKLIAVVAHLWASDYAPPGERLLPAGLLAEVLADPAMPRPAVAHVVHSFYDVAHRDNDPEGGIDAILQVYKQARLEEAEPLVLEARALIDSGLDPHSASGLAPDGTERMRRAAKALERAWQLAPDEPRAPTLMLAVLLNLEADRDTFELWFQRAMTADPDNFLACSRKLHFLSPTHRGSAAEMLQFGRWCVETGNWRGRLPLVLGLAHDRLAAYSADPVGYYQAPEVWRDFREMYEGAMANAEDEAARAAFRSDYAKAAVTCGQWQAADHLFQRMGDKPDLSGFGNKENFEYARRKVKRMTRP